MINPVNKTENMDKKTETFVNINVLEEYKPWHYPTSLSSNIMEDPSALNKDVSKHAADMILFDDNSTTSRA